MALMEVRHVTFAYREKPVLKDVSVEVGEGEVVTLLGPNGSGKSTLIKTVIGLIRPGQGTVRLAGRDISSIPQKELARHIAYVPQFHRGAFPYRVLDVILMGRMPHKTFFFRYSQEDIDIARTVMEKLSITHLAGRPYTEISGGERQLTLIARALAQGARIFVMDEPASGLDYGNQLRLLEHITALSCEGYTFIKSTHSPEHALWIAHRAVMIKKGAIIADGRCDDVVNSETLLQLYNIRVNVIRLNGTLRVCVPEMLKDNGAGEGTERPSVFVHRGTLRR
ncbi:MAG: putative ABC transporter ATP-binding protein [Syntrophorhabdus sp. PtaB.Bin047]|jgi:iron complex transport system ATP-binding protein|nr:MAG: putative ABC transporter ATP-binding protein [Syntrophorhabdus sp. PtaB.Bin047]